MSKKNKKLVAGKAPESETTAKETAKETTATETTTTAPTPEQVAKAKADAEAAKKAAKEAEAAAKKKAREDERAKKKAEREAARAAKKAEKPARTTPAHMAKVDKFAASLPTLSDEASSVFESAESLSIGDLNILSAHISLLARRRATASATTVEHKVGDRVRIHSGTDTRFIGKEGMVTRVQRARMFVKVAGFDKDAYIFTSNAEPVSATKIDVSDDAPEASSKKSANG